MCLRCKSWESDPYHKKPTTMRDTSENIPKAYMLKKPDLCQKKLTTIGGIRQNILEVCKSRRLDPRQKKPAMIGARQNIPEMRESRKPDPHQKKSVMAGGIRQNILEACKLEKPNSRQKKLTTVGGIR